jgi:hypothetical protein
MAIIRVPFSFPLKSRAPGPSFLLTTILALICLAACPPVHAFEQPEVSIKQVQIIRVYQNALDLQATLEIYNPNDLGTRATGYWYQMDVEGQKLAMGESNRPFDIPALKTFILTVPATIYFRDLSGPAAKNPFQDTLSYLFFGRVYLDTFFGKTTLPFSHQGVFNLSDYLRDQTRRLLQGL